MKRLLLILALLVSLCNVTSGIVSACGCFGCGSLVGGLCCCGTVCQVTSEGRCVCSGACPRTE